jgi:hypothetical protein
MTVALAGNDIDVDGVLMVRGVFNFRGRRAKVSSPSCPYDRCINVHIVRELFHFLNLLTWWNWHTVSDSIELVRLIRNLSEIGRCITRNFENTVSFPTKNPSGGLRL